IVTNAGAPLCSSPTKYSPFNPCWTPRTATAPRHTAATASAATAAARYRGIRGTAVLYLCGSGNGAVYCAFDFGVARSVWLQPDSHGLPEGGRSVEVKTALARKRAEHVADLALQVARRERLRQQRDRQPFDRDRIGGVAGH